MGKILQFFSNELNVCLFYNYFQLNSEVSFVNLSLSMSLISIMYKHVFILFNLHIVLKIDCKYYASKLKEKSFEVNSILQLIIIHMNKNK